MVVKNVTVAWLLVTHNATAVCCCCQRGLHVDTTAYVF